MYKRFMAPSLMVFSTSLEGYKGFLYQWIHSLWLCCARLHGQRMRSVGVPLNCPLVLVLHRYAIFLCSLDVEIQMIIQLGNYRTFSSEKMLSFGFCLNEWWGEGPAQVFGTFSRGAILVNEGVYCFQNVNNLNSKLFLRLHYTLHIQYIQYIQYFKS